MHPGACFQEGGLDRAWKLQLQPLQASGREGHRAGKHRALTLIQIAFIAELGSDSVSPLLPSRS